MKLHDPNFLTFQGEPITGIAPPTLLVFGNDGVLTGEQAAGVRHAYKLFRDALHVSLTHYLVQHRVLEDGSPVRMVSNSGLDQVEVWPVGSGGSVGYVDEFLAAPNFYGGAGFPPWDPKFSGMWKFAGTSSPPTVLKPMRLTHADAPGIQQHPGNLTWWSEKCKANKKPMIVSWYGRATRYGRLDYFGRSQQGIGSVEYHKLYGAVGIPTARTEWNTYLKPAVWLQGVKHAVQNAGATAVPVMSAGLRKETDGLKLYVVTFNASTNKLEIHKGPIRPYSGATVVVAKVCDIDFTIDATSYATANPTNPMWETMLQPLYFNDDCTQGASIVAVQKDSTVNADAATSWRSYTGMFLYFAARLMTVDVLAGTTAFTDSHASLVSTSTATTTTQTLTTTQRSYGAVDFSGSQMLIAMCENSYAQDFVKSGTGALYYPAASAQDMTETLRTYGTNYRVLYAHNSYVLASKSYAGEVNSSYHIESTYNGTSSTGSGYRTETAADPMLGFITVEGGDLRHNAVVVAEYLEVGSSSVNVTLAPAGSAQGWGPALQYVDGLGNTVTASLDAGVVVSMTTTVAHRKPAGSMSLWKDAVQVASTTSFADPDIGGQSTWGWATNQYNYFPGSTSTPDQSFLAWFVAGSSTSTFTGWDHMGSFSAWSQFVPASGYPVYATGRPVINECAFSPDEKVWFYDLSMLYADGTFANGWTGFIPPDFDVHCAFVFNGVASAFDPNTVMGGTYGTPQLSAPVFLYQVPEKFP